MSNTERTNGLLGVEAVPEASWQSQSDSAYCSQESTGSATSPECRRPLCESEQARLRAQVYAMENNHRQQQHSTAKNHTDGGFNPADELRALRQQVQMLTMENQRHRDYIQTIVQDRAKNEEATATFVAQLREEKAELERELLMAKNSTKDARQNYLAAVREKDALVRQLREIAAPQPEANPLRPQRNWVPGCEKYGIGVDEVG